MDLATYRNLAMRTKPHPDPNCDYLELARIGMIGELGEIAELIKKAKYHDKPLDRAALVKECGDFLWYLALFADVTDTPFEHSYPAASATPARCCLHLALLVSELAFTDPAYHSRTAKQAVANAISLIDCLLLLHDRSLSEALDMNIDKLKKRYPGGFTLEHARMHDSQ